MKLIAAFIVFMIFLLQYRLWLGDGSIRQVNEYQQKVDRLKQQVNEKKERNEALYAEVEDLRKGDEAVEERARHELGMIKEDETFIQVIE